MRYSWIGLRIWGCRHKWLKGIERRLAARPAPPILVRDGGRMRAQQAKWLHLIVWGLLLAGLAGGLVTNLLLRPSVDTLGLIALFALWVFFSIPACCGSKG